MNITSQLGSWISALNESAEPRIKQHSHIGYLKFVQMLSRSSEEMQAKDVPYLSPKALIERKWRDIKKIRWQCVTGNTLSSFTAPWSPFKNRIIIITSSSSSTSISISIITAIYSVVLLTEWGVVFNRRSQGESDSVLNRDRERERRAQRERQKAFPR